MTQDIKKECLPALRTLAVLTLLFGGAYTLAVTGLARLLFPRRADGSLIVRGGKVRGSELIGQSFDDPKYFWSRPSATSPQPYNSSSSSGSNLGPTNPALLDAVKQCVEVLKKSDPAQTAPIPVDLVTASGSGLDPHISPAAALWQLPRVAKVRGMGEADLRALVDKHTEGRTFGLLGEPRVNVLKLNLDLDASTSLSVTKRSHP